MNYEELVKALRHCVSDEKGVTKCAGCPYYPDITGCIDRLHTDAAAAIEELQAEVEELKAKKMKLAENSLRFVGKVRELDKRRFEPKRGKWIHGKELSRAYIGNCCVGIDYEDFRCSACGAVVEVCEKPKWNYCPNCGAKMNGEQNVE